MLSAQNISKRYGDILALDGLSLHIPAGQFCVLLGPNGAGKSTLFQLLTGLFVPSQGQIEVDGIPLATHAPQALARIGVVFQQQSLDLDLSVQQNLLFHADLHGLRRADAVLRLRAGARELGFEDALLRKVRDLSGGTRRKVELVRALLHSPGLLLMDEATVGLDPPSRHALMQALRSDVAERQSSVLWATHWVEEAAQADRVIVLHRGKIIADGTPQAVTEQLGEATLEAGFIASTQKKPPKKELNQAAALSA